MNSSLNWPLIFMSLTANTNHHAIGEVRNGLGLKVERGQLVDLHYCLKDPPRAMRCCPRPGFPCFPDDPQKALY